MAADVSLSDISAFFKQVYSNDKTQLLVERDHAVWKRIKKQKIEEGAGYVYSIGLRYAQGVGNSLTSLISNDTTIGEGALAATVTVKTGDDYAALNLDRKMLKRSSGNRQAFAEQLSYQADTILANLGDQMTTKMFGDGAGKLAPITAAGGGAITTVTLTYADDAKYFQVGMEILFATASAVIDTADEFATISAINESTGVITFNSTTLTGTAVFIGRRNVMDFSSTTNASGFSAWIPLTAPSGTTIGTSLLTSSVNRTSYQTLLGGHRLDDTSLPIDEAAFKICQKIAERGGRPSAIYCSFDVYNALAIRQWNRVVPMTKEESMTVGNSGLALLTPNGKVPFVVDPMMLRDRCFVIDESSWRICHLSDSLPERITDAAGKGDVFQLSQDAIQLRWCSWWNLICLAPVKNGVFSVSV